MNRRDLIPILAIPAVTPLSALLHIKTVRYEPGAESLPPFQYALLVDWNDETTGEATRIGIKYDGNVEITGGTNLTEDSRRFWFAVADHVKRSLEA